MLPLNLMLALLASPAADAAAPDRIVLADGRTIECRVLMESDAKIVYRAERKQRETPRAAVREIASIERSLAKFLEASAAADAGDVDAQAHLARRAEVLGLPDMARNAWLRVLTLDPSNEAAWAGSGSESARKSRRLAFGKRSYDVDTLLTSGTSSQQPLLLHTPHFTFESELPLARTLDAALAAERTYAAFYDLLGPRLGLFVFDEQPTIRVFRDGERMPSPPAPGMQSWFAPLANTLYVHDHSGIDVRVVMSDMTDVLLFNSFVRSADAKGTGMIDGWTRVGLAQLFGTAVRGGPAVATFDFRAPWLPHFKLQARNGAEMTLERVLRAGHADYHGGPRQAEYESAAYTLFHFLAFADDGKYAEPLARYIADVFQGRGGPTRFRAIFGTDLAQLESEWSAYVRLTAGN